MVSTGIIEIGGKQQHLNTIGNKLFSDFDFSDVTLVCADNQHLPAHRAVLCTSSSFIRELLYDSQHQRTFLYLGRVQHADMRSLLEFIYLGSCSLERSRLEEMVRLAAELEVEDFILESKIHQDVKDMKIIVQKDDNYDGSCEVSEKWLSPEKQSDIPVIKFEETYATKRLCLIDPLDFPKGDKQINLKSISKLSDSKQETEKNAKIDIVSEVYYVGNNEISNIKISFEEGQEDEKHKFDWFKCDKCDKMYTSQQTLYSHEKKQHGFATAKRKVFTIPKTELPEPDMSGLYNCDECDFSSEKKFRFRKHRAVIHEGFSYNCQTCPSSFKRRERLKKHIESVHEGVGFKCTECSKQFGNQRSLKIMKTRRKNVSIAIIFHVGIK